MEKSLSSIYNDIDILKEDIISTTEYKNYKKYLEKVDSNKEIKSIINSIIKLQKEIVKKEHFNEDIKDLEKELNNLYEKLDDFEDYKNYIKYSKKLNIIITNIKQSFETYFNSLIK